MKLKMTANIEIAILSALHIESTLEGFESRRFRQTSVSSESDNLVAITFARTAA